MDSSFRPPATYPFDLPFLSCRNWEIVFTTPVTIIIGENGIGKSTLIEAIAALAGYDEAGGGKGYRPVDHSRALDVSGAELAHHLRAAWLPKVTRGWFFKAESFWTVARYLDDLPGGAAPDFLSHSHGEGFLRLFSERCSDQGLYVMDEPESALSPDSQLVLLEQLATIQKTASSQVIVATHSPLLMAVPGATLLELTRDGLKEARLQDTRHFQVYAEFCRNPGEFVDAYLRRRRQV